MKEQCIIDVPYGIQTELAKEGWVIKQAVCTFIDGLDLRKKATVLLEREVEDEEE